MIHIKIIIDKHQCLDIFDNFKSNVQRNRNQIIVQNNKCQKRFEEILRLPKLKPEIPMGIL